MRKTKYIYDIVVQILLIVVVMVIFKKNPDRIQASFWAGALFVCLPMSMMAREWLFARWTNKLWWAATLQFWIVFAIPIFVMRVQHPRTSLETVSMFEVIPMKIMHQLSSYSYGVMFVVTIWSLIREIRFAQNKK